MSRKRKPNRQNQQNNNNSRASIQNPKLPDVIPNIHETFFGMCCFFYKDEIERLDRAERRAAQWIAIITGLCVAIFFLGPNNLDQCGTPLTSLYLLFTLLAWGALITGIILLYISLNYKNHSITPSMDKWKRWIRDAKQNNGNDTATIEAGLYDYITDDICDSHKDFRDSNRSRYDLLKWVQRCVFLALAFILLVVIFRALTNNNLVAPTGSSRPASIQCCE